MNQIIAASNRQMQQEMDLAYECLKDTVRSAFRAVDAAQASARIARLRLCIERRYREVIGWGYIWSAALLFSGAVLALAGAS